MPMFSTYLKDLTLITVDGCVCKSLKEFPTFQWLHSFLISADLNVDRDPLFLKRLLIPMWMKELA
jgi:hypothetical protein